MRSYRIYTAAICCLGLGAASLAGCQDVTERQVNDARQEVINQQRDAQETHREGRENISEAQRELEKTRHEAFKPVAPNPEQHEAIREQEQAVEDARREAAEKNREAAMDVREAEAEAREVEAKFMASERQKAYVASAEDRIEDANHHLDRLKNEASSQEGTIQSSTEARAERLKQSIERAKDTVSTLKSAEPLSWQDHRMAAERALTEMEDEVKRTP